MSEAEVGLYGNCIRVWTKCDVFEEDVQHQEDDRSNQ